MLVAPLVLLWFPSSASAQNLLSSEPTRTQYPSQEYYLGLQAYRAGDLDSAGDLFDAAMRSARRDIHGRWVDSIPSLAMLAECHWHMGSLPTAHEHLDHVFQIARRSRGWLSRVDWRKLTSPAIRRNPPNLWPETRSVRVLPLQRRMMYLSGEQLTEARIALGGVIEEPSVRSVDAVEIMRGLAIASYRRRIILGEFTEQDGLASGLLESTSKDAEAIYLVGDLFDYWFEYKEAIPRGFVRILGKLAELKDRGVEIYAFTGNHDMWMFGYFEEELGIPVYRKPIRREINGKSFLIGHGDGLGPGDHGPLHRATTAVPL